MLTSFAPPRADLRDAPWEAFCEWALGQGLASLAGYNLEYRLGSTRSPEWVRHRLLSLHQGTANDNVMKLVNLKRSIGELEGRRIVLLGAASFAESLYPHVAFRPVPEVRLLVRPSDVEPLAAWLGRASFKEEEGGTEALGAAKALSDTRTQLFIHGGFFDVAEQNEALLARTLPMPAFGRSARRLELEDALLVHVLLMARAGFEVPLLEFVDLRELVLGAQSMGGAYSRAMEVGAVRERTQEWRLERPLWCALGVVERLWPEARETVERIKPELSLSVRAALEREVVDPLAEVGRSSPFKGEGTVRSLLAGV